MIQLLKKHKSIILYLIFGVLTTAINVVAYWICSHMFFLSTIVSTIIAWVVAVLFAYVTNRKWVFASQTVKKAEIAKECLSFFSARLATGVVDWLCMLIFVDVLHFNDVVIKFVANILVIILNYIASKLIVFKKKQEISK